MFTDSVLAEIRAYRDSVAERFNYDLQAIIDDAIARQKASGRKTVSFAPKPVKTENHEQLPAQTDYCPNS